MSKFDETRPYGIVSGHPKARYEQGGVLYGADGKPIGAETPPPIAHRAAPEVIADEVIETNAVANAKMFLQVVLGNGLVAKADVWAEAEKNNQSWDAVKKAAALIGIESITKSPGPGKPKQECWLLPAKKTVDQTEE